MENTTVNTTKNTGEKIANGRGMITRTFAGYTVTAMVIDTTTGQTTQEQKFYPVTATTDESQKNASRDKVMKKAAKDYTGKGVPVKAEYSEEIRGITLEDFLKYSVKVERPESQTKKVTG